MGTKRDLDSKISELTNRIKSVIEDIKALNEILDDLISPRTSTKTNKGKNK